MFGSGACATTQVPLYIANHDPAWRWVVTEKFCQNASQGTQVNHHEPMTLGDYLDRINKLVTPVVFPAILCDPY